MLLLLKKSRTFLVRDVSFGDSCIFAPLCGVSWVFDVGRLETITDALILRLGGAFAEGAKEGFEPVL